MSKQVNSVNIEPELCMETGLVRTSAGYAQWNNELEQVLLLGSITVSLIFSLLMFTSQ